MAYIAHCRTACPVILARYILPVIALCVAPRATAQLEKWILRTGTGEIRTLDFSTGDPVLGAVIPSFGFGGNEDVNLMTDAGGAPLFHTAVGENDLVQVRTADFNVMPNGSGLIGYASSQSSAIAPRPCHALQYYIVHHDGFAHKTYSSTVDMALNGGEGDVTDKNVFVGEKLGEGMAVSHQMPNGCRWLFTFGFGGDSLLIKRATITESGVTDLVTIGHILDINAQPWHSCLKLSPTNDRLALSLPYAPGSDTVDVAIWPLDPMSGTLGTVEYHHLSSDQVVGIEFSPAGNYLYFLGNSFWSNMDFGRLELLTNNVQVIDTAIGSWLLSVESASNGRLYVGTAGLPSTLAEVRYPDAPAIADIGFDHDAIIFLDLGFRPVLPNSIEGEPPGSTQTPSYIDFEVELLPNCGGHLFTTDACLADSWTWDFGDGITSTADRPIHHYDVGTFDVTLDIEACGSTLTLVKPALVTVEGLQPVAVMTNPDTVCQRAIVAFTNDSQQASEYDWYFGNGAHSGQELPAYGYPGYGEFDITFVASEECITDSIFSHITVLPAAIASFHTNSDPCDEELRLINSSVDGASWYWEFGDGDTSIVRDPRHTYATMAAFDVVLISDPGNMCADTAQQTLYAGYGLIPVAWFVPNAFTPNNDEVNDVLRIRGPEVCASPVMSIFNKWGQLLWEGDALTGWDGTEHSSPVPDGVYVYVLQGKMSRSHGYVVLLR